MKKTLIIVESPTKSKTLTKFLGDAYKIEATYGHLRDLPKKRIGVDTEHDFEPTYTISKDRKEMADTLKKEAASAKEVIIATDPDREGEAIAWHTAFIIGAKEKDGKWNLGKTPVSRIVFHEITKSSIEEALKNPQAIDLKMVNAQQARRILDRLVGYKLSPLLWNKIRKGLSAGRVQSVAVRIVVEREREIKAFKADEYWEIEAELASAQKSFKSKLSQIDGKKVEIDNTKKADILVSDLHKSTYSVKSVETKEVRKWPYPPFSTSTMQQSAGNKYGWSAKKTMQASQQLYEEGFITYMRTDSFNLASEAIQSARDYIKKTFGSQYLPEEPKVYKTKSKVAQEAHEAIRPTDIYREARDVEMVLGRDASRLYDLIRKRMIACQTKETLYDQKTVEVQAVGMALYLFRTVGSKVKFDGWKAVYGEETTNGDENGNGIEDITVPDLTIGEILKLLGITPSQHFTEPPPRYTESSLIKAMEEKGIGRPSTYAPTISTIQERQYVEKEDKKLIPTELGIAVHDFLMANFSEIIDYGFTAQMEDSLDAVANGEREWKPLISEFYRPFEEKLKEVYQNADRVKIEVETTDEICEKCGAPMVVRIGKFGKFLACSKFPDCKTTKNLLKSAGMPCPKCGGDVIIRKTRRGKTFYGCSNYPKCDFASWTKPKVEEKKDSESLERVAV